MKIAAAIVAAALTLGAGSASAHVTLAEPQARAGGYYVAMFRVSHGCDGSPTTMLRIEIPAGVLIARPQPKPGWTLDVSRTALPRPMTGEGGERVGDRVAAVIWRGRLPADEFDQFGLLVKLPDAPGPLYFPTVQTCVRGEARWTDIPASGAAWGSVPHPAPVVDLTPGGQDDMAGMHH